MYFLAWLLLLHFCSNCQAEDYPPCYQEEITWQQTDLVDVVPVSESAYDCQNSCLNTSSCSSFTWYSPSSPHTPRLCILFNSKTEEVPCSSCVSGPSSCTCSSEYGCDMVEGNFIDLLPQIMSEMECMVTCASTPGCQVYTWYNQLAAVFTYNCFLFSSCPQVDFDCKGCFTGPSDCTSTTTGTTGTSGTDGTSGTTGTTESFLTTEQTVSPTNCETPEDPKSGLFNCFPSEAAIICDLLCDPGFSVKYSSQTTCNDGTWIRQPENMICEPSLLLVTGGTQEQNRAELYSTDGSLSCSLDILPGNFYNHTVQYVDGDILMVESYSGGKNYGKTYKMENDGRWVEVTSTFLGSMPYGYYSPATTAVQRANLVAAVVHRSPEYYYIETAAKMSPAIKYDWAEQFEMHKTSTYYDDRPCTVAVSWDMYIKTGEYDLKSGKSISTSLVNTANGTVTYLEPMLEDRMNHGCTYYKHNDERFVLVAGGYNNQGDLTSSEVLNLETGQWEIVGNLSVPRNGLRLAVVEGGKVLATGLSHTQGVEQFDPELRVWITVDNPMKVLRTNHAVSPIPASLLTC